MQTLNKKEEINMYIQRSSTGLAIMSPLPPDNDEQFWEVEELPGGTGPLYVTEDGKLYRGENVTTPSVPDLNTNSDGALIDALLN